MNYKIEISLQEKNDLMASDKKIGQLISIVGDICRQGLNDPFVGLVNCIVYQQVSIKAANRIWKQLINRWDIKRPMSIQQLTDNDFRKCGLNARKIKYIRIITDQVLNDNIDLDKFNGFTNEKIINDLTKIKGIGPWSARMFLIFVMNRKNVMSYKDLAIRKGLQWLYGLPEEPSEEVFKKYYHKFAPHNTLASFYLWEITLRNFFEYPSIEAVRGEEYFCYYDSPLGGLLLKASTDYLLTIEFTKKTFKRSQMNQVLKETINQLDAYFSGNLKNFDLPLRQSGTTFQQKVWSALQEIKYGEKKSYKDIAESIEHPKAYRAVGSANNKNNIPIIIPCHRVVGSSGKLTGYAGGLSKKKWLLDHENKYYG